ncbi:uncharacterized protein BHQ10_007615 [Talaromyces amestolkiae]|uniref:Xylanolytic transcriptional activator regulatory domain-containing protein n=1 Tax=Talaromyces amestolkiae TaxID=1196081 RepID=A0A364L758_TALAM|nr:uncharacterized protein BHQ10_007615 [Talaromyces amestolkiae]RAO71603.1 hypothetical protein BHQ10_007615 [Talaromyces amestolkiae]
MFIDPTPLAIALAIILSTSPHVLAAPHRRHHNTLLNRSGEIEYYEQHHAHEPLHVATLPFQAPPVTVESVKTITVIPTPARTPMPSHMQFHLPPGIPLPDGTRKPVDMKSSTTTTSSSSSTTSKTTSTSKPISSSSAQATKEVAASTTSASIIVIALPSSSLTITVPDATSVTIPSKATPTLPSIGTIEDNAASGILSVLGTSISKLTTTVTTTTTSDTTKSDSDDTKSTETDSAQQSAASTATKAKSTCSTGTTRKCCSAVHNNLKNVVGALDGITGFNLNFLSFDTSVGLDCADIDDDDTAPDGAVCWNVLSLELFQPASPVSIEREITDELVVFFFAYVHPNHPILDRDEFEICYARFLEDGPDFSHESILCMVVLALGAVASAAPDPELFKESPPGMEYMQYTMPTLVSISAWSFSSSMLAAQALVLASVYFAYIVRPLQSWRLIYSASTILQINRVGMDSLRRISNDFNDGEHLARLFWSSFLVECDRLAELELPRSGLEELTDSIYLPNCKRQPLSQPPITSLAFDDFSMEEVASIDAVCSELRSQLETWYMSIPEGLRPVLDDTTTEDPANRQAILRIRYFAARHIIYRPFLLCIVTHGSKRAPRSMVEKAALCIESCRWYLHHTTKVLARPSQYTWTFALSSLGAIIILTLASLNQDLQAYVPDIDELQMMAINNFRPWAFSSLGAVVSILEDIRKKRRLLIQV